MVPKGFTNENGDGSGRGRCEDLDECREDPERCGGGGRSCNNLPGSFDCDCERYKRQFNFAKQEPGRARQKMRNFYANTL